MNVFELVAKLKLDTQEYENDLGEAKTEALEGASGISEGFGKVSPTLAKIGTAAVIAGAAATIAIGKSAVESYASYEQLSGGVTKLFQNDSGQVMKFANEAYKTAGMSANDYMDTVTSFSASLITSLGGNTAQSAQYADRAITDMADNANTFGTSMDSIQNAYQGFAKGNYTMLDNLKLGYGGTKEEMIRLVNEAANSKDAMAALGVTVKADSLSFDNIINAISVTQQRLGIMGTTAKEAAGTIEGSINMLKASWSNLLSSLSSQDGEIDISGMVDSFAESFDTMLSNVVPAIIRGMKNAGKVLGELLPQIIESLASTISENIGGFIEGGLSIVSGLIKGIAKALPTAIPHIVDTIVNGLVTFLENADMLIEAGAMLMEGLVRGLINAIPKLVEAVPRIVLALCTAIVECVGELVLSAIKIGIAFVDAIVSTITGGEVRITSAMSASVSGAVNVSNEASASISSSMNEMATSIESSSDRSSQAIQRSSGIQHQAAQSMKATFNVMQLAAYEYGQAYKKSLEQQAELDIVAAQRRETFANAVKTSWQNLTDAINSTPIGAVANAQFDNIDRSMQKFSETASQEGKKIADSFISMRDGIANAGDINGIMDAMVSNVTKFELTAATSVLKIAKDFDGMNANIGNSLTSLNTKYIESGNAFNGLGTIFMTSGTKIQNVSQMILTHIISSLGGMSNASQTASSATSSAFNDMSQSINSSTNASNNIIQKFGQALSSQISAPATREVNIFTGVFKEIPSILHSVVTQAQSAASKFSSAFSGMSKGVEAEVNKIKGVFNTIADGIDKIGAYVAEGFLNGFDRAWSKVVAKVKDGVEEVKNLIRTLFGINSPSRWAREMANYVGEGFNIGFAESFGDIQPVSDFQNKVNKMMSSFDYGLGDITATKPTQVSVKNFNEQEQKVTVVIEGDAARMFRLMNIQSNRNAKLVGV